MSGVNVFRGVCRGLSVCLSTWMGKRERVLSPFLLLGKPRQDPAQALRVVPEGFICSLCQYSVTDDLVADPNSSCPFAVSSTWLTSWHTVSTQ